MMKLMKVLRSNYLWRNLGPGQRENVGEMKVAGAFYLVRC